MIHIVTTIGINDLNKKMPYFFFLYKSIISQITIIIIPTKINTGFIDKLSALISLTICTFVSIKSTIAIKK